MFDIENGVDDKNECLLEKITKNKNFEEIFTISNIQKGESSVRLKMLSATSDIFALLKVNYKYGLDTDNKKDISFRVNKWGTNKFIEEEEKGFMYFVFETLEDKLLKILLFSGILSLIIGIFHEGIRSGWMEGFAILTAVFIVVLVSAFNNYNKEQQFVKLSKENRKKQVIVRRNGIKYLEIPVEDLLVGDIVYLKIGDIAPVDGILVDGKVGVDESPMTGESDIIKKTVNISSQNNKTSTPFIISGTLVKEGKGEMIVCIVGKNTQSEISRKAIVHDTEEKTPLQKKLNFLAQKIGDFGLIAAFFIGSVLIMKEILFRIVMESEVLTYSMLDTIINAFIISVTVIVVAIPEGLPMAVTLSLAYSVMKMKEENNLVRHIDASETMGNVNNICVDKTGTLTKGKMKVRDILIGQIDYKADECDMSLDLIKNVNLIIEAVINNVSSWIELEKGKFTPKGDSTECALLKFLIRSKINLDKFRISSEPIACLPFNSENKLMCSIYKINNNLYKLFVKGAPELIISRCSEVYNKDSKSEFNFEKINENYINLFNWKLEEYAERAERTLAVAYKELNADEINILSENNQYKNRDFINFYDQILKDLRLLCLVGISDCPRKEVKNAISQCQASGIKVRMITGDNIKTAIAIAKEVGILSEKEAIESMLCKPMKNEKINSSYHSDSSNPPSICSDIEIYEIDSKIYALEGREFKVLSGGYKIITADKSPFKKSSIKFELCNKNQFSKCIKNLKVIARASPDDKFLLVLGLKELDNIVAVTGDGTNDAPALKLSHVGFSMGKKGTDIAKEASDIILLDDSFNSIITAIKYGRNVYDSIRKFLQFQLTTNIVAVFMTLLGGIILKDSPLNAIQMLWVNLIMDSFASIALATEPPSDELLKRRPYNINEPIITHIMFINIISQAVFQIIILQIILFYGDLIFDVPSDRELSHYEWNTQNGYHFSIFFNIFVFMQVFNSINSRKLNKDELNVFKNIFNNMIYVAIQTFIVITQILLIQFGGKALRTQPLTWRQHLVCILIASLTLIFNFIVKLFPIREVENENSSEGRGSLRQHTTRQRHILKMKNI